MRYWFDTEFIERGPDYPIELLSIGIVAEDGRELYREADWADRSHANPWVQENVITHLHNHRDDTFGMPCPLIGREEMRRNIREFCDPEQYGKLEFWAYYADYDWVVLCQLFGTMMELPKNWPMFAMDIKQFAVMLGNPKLPEQGKDEHHALADAAWNWSAWEFLVGYGRAAGFPRTFLET